MERYMLSMGRIKEISTEFAVQEPFLTYFRKVASFIGMLEEEINDHKIRKEYSFEELKDINRRLYEDVLPDNYEKSYANPSYAAEKLGSGYGRLLSFLYTQIRGEIPFLYEGRMEDVTILNELFLEIYNVFEMENLEGNLPDESRLQEIIYWFVSDYCDVTVRQRVKEQLDPQQDFAKRIIEDSDLRDLRYLFSFGEYITENEIQTAEYLNQLPMEKITAMADTYTEGYRIGFLNTGKDLSRKKVVNIRYRLGFERIVREAIINFEKMGLQPTIFRSAVHAATKGSARVGYYGAVANQQYEHDHREDEAIWLDGAFINRKLEVLRVSYEEFKDLAAVHAGPAVIETFGEEPFAPVSRDEAIKLSDKQRKLSVRYTSEAGELVNQYIRGEERSYTIIAFPIPEIGPDYPEIFDETVKINTLDYALYQEMQQAIIDELDRGEYVIIKGRGGNKTDLRVSLQELKDPLKETIFENCVADVNIPVGEVFTSPVLRGTTGCLFASEVYLDGLKFADLKIQFTDGYITDYTCENFQQEEENRAYIRDHILHHHDTLPMGEFAIGTNTTAYVMAKKYKIFHKLPILIAEKTGPHFAVGDTCYSHAEDVKVYNPDGKEIIARENEASMRRKESGAQAYFNCHTDITIPYDELAEIAVITKKGDKIPILADGRFVLEKCHKLNDPFPESLVIVGIDETKGN